jgi:hypothetical protein
MRQTALSRLCLLFASSIQLCCPSLARADGGTIRLSKDNGTFRVTVFTSPAYVRAGPVDISVLVQDRITGEVAPDAKVDIRVVSRAPPDVVLCEHATKGRATNKLYQAAVFDLPRPGSYLVQVSIDGGAPVGFSVDAGEPLPSWLAMGPWVGWPATVILLFAIHQVLVRRGRSAARPVHAR